MGADADLGKSPESHRVSLPTTARIRAERLSYTSHTKVAVAFRRYLRRGNPDQGGRVYLSNHHVRLSDKGANRGLTLWTAHVDSDRPPILTGDFHHKDSGRQGEAAMTWPGSRTVTRACV